VSTQPELSFEPTPKGPTVTSADIALLLNILAAGAWLKAAELRADPRFIARFGELNPEAADRRIRAIASASDGQIISYPGSPGYKLTLAATIEEIQRATAKLRHQASEMDARALQIDRVYHAKLRP
jgi:hypothetical protein